MIKLKNMKKILIILGVIILIVIIMFLANICPPKGPWPTPPWCKGSFEIFNYPVSVQASHLSQIKAVNMYDTWGRNYNMNMFETTWSNIDQSFDRVKSLGAQEVFVHDFDRAKYKGEFSYKSLDYKFIDETFWNDFRDESISKTDLEKMVQSAHSRGLKFGIKRNLAFVNIGKFILSGISGEISSDVAKDYKEFNSSHTDEWIKDYFQKWQNRLVEKGKMYQEAGVDIMSISPGFQDPTFAGKEELANGLWKNLITEVRKEFKGQIMVDFNVYGFNDGNNGEENWLKYDYYKTADVIEVKVYKILEKYQTKSEKNLEIMKQEIGSMLSDLDAKAKQLGIKISVFWAPSSYKDGLFNGPVEFLDIRNSAIKNLEKDYDAQSEAYNYFFEAVKNKTNITGINIGNFTWDDALDPEVKALVSISASFRNKPAEQVVKEWFNK